MSFPLLVTIGFIFGIGLGFFVQRAGLCFAHGLGEIFVGKPKRIIRMTLLIFIISALGFYFSSFISADLGLKPIGELRGFGFYNLLSGMIFGAGIILNGGCILGTLRQLGEGNLTFLIVLLSFIPGMALVVFVLNPLLNHSYNVQNIILPGLLNIDPGYIIFPSVLGAIIWYTILSLKRN